MYDHLHYPTWSDHDYCIWVDYVLEDNTPSHVIFLVPEQGAGEEWTGNIDAGVFAINPLNIDHPAFSENDTQERAVLFGEMLNAAFESVQMLGIDPSSNGDFWLAGGQVTGKWQEGETVRECWKRITDQHSGISVLTSMIDEGEYATALRSLLSNEAKTTLDQHQASENKLEDIEKALVDHVRSPTFGIPWQAEQQEKCIHGIKHLCRQDRDAPAIRGAIPVASMLSNTVQQIRRAVRQQGVKVSEQSLKNLADFGSRYQGTNGHIFSQLSVNQEGNIEVAWTPAPDKFAEFELDGDDRMSLRISYQQTDNKGLDEPDMFQFNSTMKYSMEDLSDFIDTGKVTRFGY